MSVAPPAVNGTMILMVFSGYLADAEFVNSKAINNRQIHLNSCFIFIP
jgi:hypothetical protein